MARPPLIAQMPRATLYTPEDIERATRHYIWPHCQSIDPAQGPEIREVYASREDLFAATDRLLHQPAESKYLLLLADSGMGKTSFLLNYFARHLRRVRKPFHLEDAEAYVQQLNDQKFGDCNDWPLPTLEAAMSLMEREEKNGELYVDPVFDRKQWWIWTADLESAGRAWYVNVYYGVCSHGEFGYVSLVRAVRS